MVSRTPCVGIIPYFLIQKSVSQPKRSYNLFLLCTSILSWGWMNRVRGKIHFLGGYQPSGPTHFRFRKYLVFSSGILKNDALKRCWSVFSENSFMEATDSWTLKGRPISMFRSRFMLGFGWQWEDCSWYFQSDNEIFVYDLKNREGLTRFQDVEQKSSIEVWMVLLMTVLMVPKS